MAYGLAFPCFACVLGSLLLLSSIVVTIFLPMIDYSISLGNALVSSSFEIGESITGGISSGSPMVLSCDRVSPCCCVVTCILLACW